MDDLSPSRSTLDIVKATYKQQKCLSDSEKITERNVQEMRDNHLNKVKM